MSELLQRMTDRVIAGKIAEVEALVKQALDGGIDPNRVIEEGLLPGMDVVGARMKSGEMFIPEVLRSARSMQAGLALATPLMADGTDLHVGSVVIGTVEGDLHDIGKNLVSMMMTGAGFRVVDLGINVAPQAFVDAVRREKPRIVAMSALLTTTMPKMAETVAALAADGLRDGMKIMVGGAPVTSAFAHEIGADGYGSNGAEAVDQAKALLR